MIHTFVIEATEQQALKNVSNCLTSNIYCYLETSVGQTYCLYLNVVRFKDINTPWFIFSTPVLIKHLWQLKTLVVVVALALLHPSIQL